MWVKFTYIFRRPHFFRLCFLYLKGILHYWDIVLPNRRLFRFQLIKISLAHWIHGSPVTYRVEPWHSFEFCNIALASACIHRHFSNCSPVFILPSILFLHLSHPPWLQFKNCEGVPLYPVDTIRLFLST